MQGAGCRGSMWHETRHRKEDALVGFRRGGRFARCRICHPGGNPGANPKSVSHRCHPILVACVWQLTNETINLPLGCLQDGYENIIKLKPFWQ